MKLHWGNAIFIFFVIFLSLAAFFIVFSLRQNNDLVYENYYEKGAEYTQQININERSEPFADSIKIDFKNENIVFTFCNTITNNTDTIFIYFYRPSDKQLDYNSKFNTKSGSFIIDKSKIKKGRYIVSASWRINNLDYEITNNLFIE